MNTEILNKYIELINKGYCSDCNELNCLGNFPHKDIAETIEFILKENNELKDKVKELSGWDKNKDTRNSRQRITIKNLLKKNQQLKEQLESSIGIVKHNMIIQKHVDRERKLQKKIEAKEEAVEFIEYLENKISELNEITKNEEDEETIYYALVRITAINELIHEINKIRKEINNDD